MLYEKILGSLAGSAIGDAMGAATEVQTEEEIIRRFGKRVNDFQEPPKCHPHSGGRRAGQITDDSSLTFCLAKTYVANEGEISVDLVTKTIIDWSGSEYYPRFAGPATIEAVKRLKDGEDPVVVGRHGEISLRGVTNGAAMKISPAGLMHPGDPTAAMEDAITICVPTHGTQLAMSGACAVACAVSEALTESATVESVLSAALKGAIDGERLGEQRGRIAAGASVVERIKLAYQIVLGEDDKDLACRKIGKVIGSGLPTSEAVPAALGIFMAMEGNPMKCIEWGVNIGDDTDTVACIVGAISGAFAGIGEISPELFEQVQEINGLDLEGLARDMVAVIKARGE